MMMKPVELWHGDCLELMKNIPDNIVNLVLIDPPYGVSRDTNFTKGRYQGTNTDRFRVSMNFGDWDNNFTGLDIIVQECYRILKQGGTLICFYDLWKITHLKAYFDNAKFKQIRFIEWLKTNPVPLNNKLNYLTNSREVAVTGVKGSKPTFHSEYDNGVYQYPICHERDRFHPTQKPLRLIECMIEKHSNKQDLVVDCFMGSGTTAVACVNTGRNFIGIELDDNYFNIAKLRVNAALNQTQPIFINPTSKNNETHMSLF